MGDIMNSREVRKALLATGSVAALALAMGQQARAQAPVMPAWWVSLEGGYQFVNGDAIDLPVMGTRVSLSPDDGLTGRLHFGGKLDTTGWTGAVGVTYGKSKTDNFSSNLGYSGEYAVFDGLSSYGMVKAEYDEWRLMLDFEIGRDVGLGGSASARVFGGVRFAKFDGHGHGMADYYYNGEYYNLNGSTDHSFTGVGPRAGIDAWVPIAPNLDLDVSAAGAVLFGRRKLSYTVSYYYAGPSYSDSETDSATVPNVEASAALTYSVTPNFKISGGYRVEQFWNVMPTVESGGIKDDNRLFHGPFLRLTLVGF